MVTVTWYWIDGTYDSFAVDTRKHAEAMREQLYTNDLIVSVEIDEEE